MHFLCVGPCGFGLPWAAHKGPVGVDATESGGGEEMYMDGAPALWKGK